MPLSALPQAKQDVAFGGRLSRSEDDEHRRIAASAARPRAASGPRVMERMRAFRVSWGLSEAYGTREVTRTLETLIARDIGDKTEIIHESGEG